MKKCMNRPGIVEVIFIAFLIYKKGMNQAKLIALTS